MIIKKPIFIFPSAAWDDFSVYEEQVEDDLCFYYVSYIYYPTLQDGIDYLIQMKNAYRDFLGSYKRTSQGNEEYNESMVYKTYDIEIHKYPEGIIIYLSVPVFTDAFDVYVWLNGAIEQLECVEKNGIV